MLIKKERGTIHSYYDETIIYAPPPPNNNLYNLNNDVKSRVFDVKLGKPCRKSPIKKLTSNPP